MIRIVELTKHYGSTRALERLSLEIPPGAVFGLLGPNGAGKTTLLRLIMGFLFPDDGQIDRGGISPAQIGYLPERAFFPPRSTIGDYLATLGRLAGLQPAVEDWLAEVGMAGMAGRRLGACSRGMLQRVGLAQALLANPSLLLLDEPALGLDPTGQKFMREQILAMQQAGKTVLLSSHHLDEVTRVCSHVAVISHGRLVRSGPLETLLAERPQVSIATGPQPPGLFQALEAEVPGLVVTPQKVTLFGDAVAYKAQVLGILLDARVDICRLTEERATLEEIYIEATTT